MMVVQEQEDYRREYLEFRFHGVLLPRGVCRGERFSFEMAVSAVFLSTVNPPRKRWRIGSRLHSCGRMLFGARGMFYRARVASTTELLFRDAVYELITVAGQLAAAARYTRPLETR
ncbi:hypothetical protein NDU88_006090 [Pleurodeles waltl]|uniref:Uncharacterized protein n=1 Tax=Pleurodeles waltl TaxID=8319 RepID=A0AAV7RKL5_PLEWA|nr:hypothetical protein NDU88_006090 [Pleurodeles waltl]